MVIDQVRCLERTPDREYMRVFELVKWKDGTEDVRFGYYSREKGEGPNDWEKRSLHTNMEARSLVTLLKRAKKRRKFRHLFTI